MASKDPRSAFACAGLRPSPDGSPTPSKVSPKKPARAAGEKRHPKRISRPPTSGFAENRRADKFRTVQALSPSTHWMRPADSSADTSPSGPP